MKVLGITAWPGKLLSNATQVEPRKLLRKAVHRDEHGDALKLLRAAARNADGQRLKEAGRHARDTLAQATAATRQVTKQADGQQLLDTGLQVLDALSRVSEPGHARKAAGSGRLRTVTIATGAAAGLVAVSARISELRRRSEMPSAR